MCSASEAGSFLRRIDLNKYLRLIDLDKYLRLMDLNKYLRLIDLNKREARDLVKSRTEDEAPQLLVAQMPLGGRLHLGRLSIALNQRLHLGVEGRGLGARV